MGSYYYLIAQLPFLVYEQKPPMSSQTFKSLAESLLNSEDAELFQYLSYDPQFVLGANDGSCLPATGCDFIDGWREWERTFRLNLAKHRTARLKREGANAAEPPFVPADAASTAAKAVSGENSPMEGEIFIDKARWNVIDMLAGYSIFERNNVYAYYLKLLLLERREAFNTERGFSEYKSLYAQIIESANSSLGE